MLRLSLGKIIQKYVIINQYHLNGRILMTGAFTLIQHINLSLSTFILHFLFRLYSMILASILFGLVSGLLYTPRTLSMAYPVYTLSAVKR